MQVEALPAFADNNVLALNEPPSRSAVLVDPGDAAPALEHLDRRGLALEAILVTHHHRDHVGGLPRLLAAFPRARVVGPAAERARIGGLTETVGEGDEVAVLASRATVLDVPGHTRGHVAYFFPDAKGGGDLFSGDTVFGGTIGNLFEGTPDDMFASMGKIRALPEGTRLWCGHEYTLEWVRAAARFDPGNARLADYLKRLEALPRGRPTVPLSLDDERATSPFFRWDDPALVRRLGGAPGLDTFRKLCEVL
jgi:hydroxyacylglutathione hydrolase